MLNQGRQGISWSVLGSVENEYAWILVLRRIVAIFDALRGGLRFSNEVKWTVALVEYAFTRNVVQLFNQRNIAPIQDALYLSCFLSIVLVKKDWLLVTASSAVFLKRLPNSFVLTLYLMSEAGTIVNVTTSVEPKLDLY